MKSYHLPFAFFSANSTFNLLNLLKISRDFWDNILRLELEACVDNSKKILKVLSVSFPLTTVHNLNKSLSTCNKQDRNERKTQLVINLKNLTILIANQEYICFAINHITEH